ncbi:MAG: protein kinase [Thermodesulfobacteriota bacterium]|nr:protein kinase [Thermodesulfobacteriota bacterium]
MRGKLVTDTTDFCSIDKGDEILVGNKRYIITGHEKESRFGMDDPKFWVKKAIDTDTGEKKIIKLSHFENFQISLAGVRIKCFRNPDKEGEILKLVKNHLNFMQGNDYRDEKGNNVRVLDIIYGMNFFSYIDSITMDHATYFHKVLPGILRHLIRAFQGIRFLHTKGFKHGDIRNDHIIIDRETGNYVWIDFDYDYETLENPFGLDIFGLGNILLYALGKGFHTIDMIQQDTVNYGDLINQPEPGDFSILFKWRLMNLRKIYPYIPRALNDILMHFSKDADVYYEFVDEMIEDLNRSLHSVFE